MKCRKYIAGLIIIVFILFCVNLGIITFTADVSVDDKSEEDILTDDVIEIGDQNCNLVVTDEYGNVIFNTNGLLDTKWSEEDQMMYVHVLIQNRGGGY